MGTTQNSPWQSDSIVQQKKWPHGAFERSSNRLPTPNGHAFRFRLSRFLSTGLENDLFRLETQVQHSPSGIQSHAEAVVVVAIRRIVPIPIRRPAIASIVVPAAAPVHPIRALRTVHQVCLHDLGQLLVRK